VGRERDRRVEQGVGLGGAGAEGEGQDPGPDREGVVGLVVRWRPGADLGRDLLFANPPAGGCGKIRRVADKLEGLITAAIFVAVESDTRRKVGQSMEDRLHRCTNSWPRCTDSTTA
jgi:hypothetical protein